MSVGALAGLYMMLIAGIAFAAIIAICEFTWRKRKLAVDENVSFRYHFFSGKKKRHLADEMDIIEKS